MFSPLVQANSDERGRSDSKEKTAEEDNRKELTQKDLLSFARQIAVGMVIVTSL